ncbi:hypothetical protein EDC96DRAFT_257016 [Choanephora cucurbitarum]|nr:hypothetical protein EDC96DRAFT_257016 [Choanephora cucurbitarum]
MLAGDLPFEIQAVILDHLNSVSRIQYSLVSRHWRQAARHLLFKTVQLRSEKEVDAFTDMLLESSSLGESVRKLVFKTPASMNEAQQYSALIHLTPNLQILETGRHANRLYQVAVEEIEHGHWQHLHSINDSMILYDYESMTAQELEQIRGTGPDYYALASALRDRLSAMKLDVTSERDSPFEPHCFQPPSYITRQTRFGALENLVCFSEEKTTIRSLDSALSLCPNATEVTLSLCYFHSCEDNRLQFRPNTTATTVHVFASRLTETSLNYLLHKFLNVKQLIIRILDYDDDEYDVDRIGPFEMPTELATQLAYYACTTEKFDIWFRGLMNNVQLFVAFTLVRWQGEMQINLQSHYIQFEHDRSKPKHSGLYLCLDVTRLDLRQPSLRAYFNQLDVLSIGQIGLEHYPILTHCSQLQELHMQYGHLDAYDGPYLPIHSLVVSYGNYNIHFLRQFSALTPHLKNARLTFNASSKVKIDMPSITFESLSLSIGQPQEASPFYFHLTQFGQDRYYQAIEDQLYEMEADEFKKHEPVPNKARVICKGIKHLEIHRRVNGPLNRLIQHTFL